MTTLVSTTDSAFLEARQRYLEEFLFALESKAGGNDALMLLTSGKPRGQVESIVCELMPLTTLEKTAGRFLLDTDELYDALDAQPWGIES